MPTAPKPATGLRERKKIRTRQAIRRAAYRLFEERGFDATRVDEIAEAAEVSPSTVFRYFPTKEDIVLSDEEDPVIEAALRARPADEPPLTALRAALHDVMAELWRQPEAVTELRQRMRLVASVPAIRARMHESIGKSGDVLHGAIAERTGRARGDLEIRILTGAVLGALTEALLHWTEEGLEDDLMDVLDRSFRVLEHGLAD
ncbi:acyl-CoA-like ligand-binding transcription factor [Streptomyces millisiae]|uniref:TetR family transcriptional regulator n=1 Tax=Streptomyces millisiae TaxID=3075542 RepID=A0ABU2LVR7_9ACTN|nr:TetR family transcriptional regulator [Streptomyces sp. DSM 44918]MDT0321620.1 TetR family transcriptional regulator [Streptomyces sp. DSM 44918]